MLCLQEVLASSSDNYIASVYEGAAHDGLQQTDSALDSYRRATQIDPKQTLAWQVYSVLPGVPQHRSHFQISINFSNFNVLTKFKR